MSQHMQLMTSAGMGMRSITVHRCENKTKQHTFGQFSGVSCWVKVVLQVEAVDIQQCALLV